MAKRNRIAVIDSGSGNLRSVLRAITEVGGEAYFVRSPSELDAASKVLVPGQGRFGDCMKSLQASGMAEALKEWTIADKPYFGICLGMQILLDGSEENPGIDGLGIIPGQVKRFSESAGKVPHMGWNLVSPTSQCATQPMWQGLDADCYFYFTHSYFCLPKEKANKALHCYYGEQFTAGLSRGNLFAVQFHPEKSQGAGLRLLKNFVRS